LDAAAKHLETASGAHYYLGRLAKQSGDYGGALKEFDLAVRANPNMSESYAEMGALYMRLKDYAQAEKAIRKALELRPDSYTANLNLLVLYQRTKDPRAEVQGERFRQIREKGDESRIEMLRSIQVQP
jgi:Flp pilus assembly protein TadD